MGFSVLTTACKISFQRDMLAANRSSENGISGRCNTHNFLCLASERRGFGNEPIQKNDGNIKNSKRTSPIGADQRNLSNGQPISRPSTSRRAPDLSSVDKKSSNVVLDRQFVEKLEAVRRSALEQKRAEEEKLNSPIDYDAPIESDSSKIGFGAKVGVGVAVVVLGLVFALVDFIPSGSIGTKEDAVIRKQLGENEKSKLQEMLQQFETVLIKSPEDATALKGAASTLLELGEYEQSSSLIEKLNKMYPADLEALQLLGEVKYDLKDYEGSASAYRNALSASDHIKFDLLRGLTNALLAAKKPDEAVQILLSVRQQLNTREQIGQQISSTVYGKVDKQVPAVDPIQVELLLGKAYSDWGHISDAVAVYDNLISSHPSDFRGYLAKGIILKENGRSGDAERMFIQARFFAPEKAKALVERYSR